MESIKPKDAPVEFKINCARLLEILRISQSIIDKKMDIDGSKMQFSIKNNQLTLIASDGAMYMKGLMEIIAEKIDLDFCVSITVLYDLIRRINDEYLEFLVDENNVRVIHAHGRFNLLKTNTIISQGSPNDPQVCFDMKASMLTEALKAVRSTVAIDDIRHQFKGIMVVHKKELVFWSTDGHKLSLYKMHKSETSFNENEEFQTIWPKKFVDCISSISGDKSKITIYSKHVEYSNGNVCIISPLINATVIDYEKIVNSAAEEDLKLDVDTAEFIKELERVMIVADDSKRVSIKVSENKCTLHASNIHNGESFEDLSAETVYHKEKLTFSFNGEAILSFMRSIKGKASFLYYKAANTILIKKGDGQLYITKALKEKSVDFYHQ